VGGDFAKLVRVSFKAFRKGEIPHIDTGGGGREAYQKQGRRMKDKNFHPTDNRPSERGEHGRTEVGTNTKERETGPKDR